MIHRTILAGLLAASSALAGPALTTIQDVLYKADGTRFNGTLAISWSSFQAADNSSIATQITSVRVVNGNLHVQLVPTAGSVPAMVYSVTYSSDGMIQFKETWSVPASTHAVRLSDVRVASSNAVATDTTGSGGSVQESDVVGLSADLTARPIEGPGYAPGGVAVVNSSGALETASGYASDCVHIDGSSGPCGTGGSAGFVDEESPAGVVDGSNTQFSLSGSPNPVSSLSLYRNGVLQKAGLDYTLNGQTVTFTSAATPQPGDTLLASYRLAGAAPSISFMDNDSLSGTEDGSNQQFTLSAAPNPATSLDLFLNGLLQKAGQDYSLSGQTVTFVTGATPQPGDTLLASYRLSGNGTSSSPYPNPQVLCSGTGTSTTATALSSVGTCSIPAGLLLPGDRVEVRFDFQHQGSSAGFSFEIHWGGTVVAHRDATLSDTQVTGRLDAGLQASGALLSFQSWGGILPFTAGVANATDAFGSGLTIDFQGMLSSVSGDSLTLGDFTVVRIP